MKQIKLNLLLVAIAFTVVLASCHKDKINPQPDKPSASRLGLYVLNQGVFQSNNSTLTYYDYTTKQLTPDIYSSANGEGLGDTGNDIGIYGAKMYIVVNYSNVVEIVNPKTSKLIKKISFKDDKQNGRQPRSIAFYKNNAFITSYDGTVAVLDTATLTVSKYINVGRNPEQLVVSNDKLYVANSGGLSFGNPDNTVSVIDLNTLTETKKITVISNPVSIVADTYGHVYVLSLGITDYSSGVPVVVKKPGMSIIDNKNDVSISQTNLNLGFSVPMSVQGDFVYYVTADNKIAAYNAKTQTPAQANFISDGTVITSAYSVTADPLTGEIFIGDAKDYNSNGTLYAFDKTGKKEYSITTGISPGKVAFVNK
jgi:YVTN family beta-propeller protein